MPTTIRIPSLLRPAHLAVSFLKKMCINCFVNPSGTVGSSGRVQWSLEYQRTQNYIEFVCSLLAKSSCSKFAPAMSAMERKRKFNPAQRNNRKACVSLSQRSYVLRSGNRKMERKTIMHPLINRTTSWGLIGVL